MAEVSPEASGEFVHRVKGLLEAITGKPYGVVEKQRLEGHIWGVYLNEDKVKLAESLAMSHGAQWVGEVKDNIITIYSDKFLDITDLASDLYDFDFRDTDVLLDRKNWAKYRREVPRLIAELEAAEGIANELNKKYCTKIKLWSGEKPYFETGFDAKGLSEGEKLHEIERHARAMIKAWECQQKWVVTVGAKVYRKTERSRMGLINFRDDVISRLQYITKSE